jgi:hypothetical protein
MEKCNAVNVYNDKVTGFACDGHCVQWRMKDLNPDGDCFGAIQ